MKICILCGGVGHDQSECPWVEAQQERSVAPLFAISAVVALTCIASAVGLAVWLHGVNHIASAVGLAVWLHGVNLSWAQAAWLVLEVFLAVSGSTAASTALYKAKFWRRWLAQWRYRKIDPDLCCCGSQMGQGGSICHHGGCRSAKEYAITRELGGK